MKRKLAGAVLGSVSAILTLALPVAVLALGDEIPLPPGYEYPRVPTVKIPDPFFDEPNQCSSCADEDSQLRFYYQDYVGFRRNLDTYAPYTVTWELVVFEHGFKQPWLGPQFAARLYQHSADQVRFVTRERLVVFDKVTGDDGKVTLRCSSEDDWTIRREGERVIVQSPQRWFAFDTPDYGQTWRLVETCFAGIPVPVKLHYDGPIDTLPSSLEYPDGKIATIEPAEGLEAIGRLKLPNGMEYKLEYDPNGFPRILEEYALSKEPPKKELHGFTIESKDGKVTQTLNYRETGQDRLVLSRRWVWENDAEGRIRHFVAPCGHETELTFAGHTTDKGDELLSIKTDTSTGNYEYMRHIQSGANWTVERGHGKGSQPLDESTLDSRRVSRNIHHHMQTVAYTDFKRGHTTLTDYGTNGMPNARKQLDSTGALLWSRKVTLPAIFPLVRISQTSASRVLPCGDRISYTYVNGFVKTATYRGNTHVFSFDSLGRMRSHEVAGHMTEWSYTDRNQVRLRTDHAIEGDKGEKPTERAITWNYYLDGRLKSTQYDDFPSTTYTYDCDGVKAIVMGTYQIHDFRYYDNGRLRRHAIHPHPDSHHAPEPVTDSFTYRSDGRLETLIHRVGKQNPISITFTYDGKTGERQIKAVDGPVTADMYKTISSEVTTEDGEQTRRVIYNVLGTVIPMDNQTHASDQGREE